VVTGEKKVAEGEGVAEVASPTNANSAAAGSNDDGEVQFFLNKSQFMRQNSQMRQGEITLQMIRINKRLKKKKEVALDVLKMLKDIEGGGSNAEGSSQAPAAAESPKQTKTADTADREAAYVEQKLHQMDNK